MNAIGLLPGVPLNEARERFDVGAATRLSGENSPRNPYHKFDGGQLIVRAEDATLWTTRGLTTVEAWMTLVGGDTIRSVVGRVTTRHRFATEPRSEIYLKRYYPLNPAAEWRERLRAWTNLQSYRRGASQDWSAHVALAALGIATATPVAFGACSTGSFFAADALIEHASLRDLLRSMCPTARRDNEPVAEFWRQCGAAIGAIVRTLHEHGLFHGDLYFDHFLVPNGSNPRSPFRTDLGENALKLIDLGRMRRGRPWEFRGVAKDLSQLMYSARPVLSTFKPAFLTAYRKSNTSLSWYETAIRLVASIKAARIANHTERHRL